MPHWYWETTGVLLALQVLWASGRVVSMLRRIAVAQEAQSEALGTLADSLLAETEREALAVFREEEKILAQAPEVPNLWPVVEAQAQAEAAAMLRKTQRGAAPCPRCGGRIPHSQCLKVG